MYKHRDADLEPALACRLSVKLAESFPAERIDAAAVLRPDPLGLWADFRKESKIGAVIRCHHLRLRPRRVIKTGQVPTDLYVAAAFPAGVGHHSTRRFGQNAAIRTAGFYTDNRQQTRIS